MQNKQTRGKSFLLSVVSLSLLSPHASALPDPRANISALTSKVSLDGVGQVLGDHKSSNTLYVKPGGYKFKGKFFQTNGAVDCEDLYNLRKTTYRMPTEEEFEGVITKNSFYSPTFESTVGVAAKNLTLLKRLTDAKFETADYMKKHRDIYGRYSSTLAQLDLLKGDLETVDALVQDRNSQFVSEIAIAATEAQKVVARNNYRTDLVNLNNRRAQITSMKYNAAREHNEALKSWAPFKDELDWLQNVESNLQTSFDKMQILADQSLERSERIVKLLEEKIVGVASTGYSLSPDAQIARLSERIKKAKLSGFHVQAVTPFNIRLNPGVTKSNLGVKDSIQNLDYKLITYHFPQNTRVAVGDQKRWVELSGTKLKQDGKPAEDYRFSVSDFGGSFGSSQAFEMPVTQGALCGYGKSDRKNYKYTDSKGNKFSKTVELEKYDFPSADQPIFVQNVALRYNYYQKAEPIEGSCRMNVDKSSSFVRNAGKKTSWSWFKKSSHSWDNTKKSLVNNMGLSCKLTKRPQGANPEESKAINRAFEKALYKDMFNMFLITYAKDYTVKPVKPELLDSDSKIFSKIGTGVMSLCGTNLYCQIGGIVLKSLDELVGARHTGTTSNTTTMKGVLSRTMSLDGYLIAEGNALMEMRVCVDHKKCDE
jgi:hypothetical protein